MKLYLILVLITFSVSAIQLTEKERDWLTKKEIITFVSQTKYPPFEFVDKDGNPKGMCIELVNWLSEELGFKVRFLDMSFLGAQEAVLTGKADVLTSLFYSKDREERFEFSEMMWEVPALIFVKSERPDINSLKDLQGKRVAMQRGDYAEEFLKSQKIKFVLVPTETFDEATDLVIAGKADAIIGDKQIVLYHLFKNDLTDYVKSIGTPLYIGRNCMGVREGQKILIDILNKGILKARENGIFKNIGLKWVGTKYIPKQSWFHRNAKYLLLVLVVIAVIALVVILWNIHLYKVIARRTRELLEERDALKAIVKTSKEKYKLKTIFWVLTIFVLLGLVGCYSLHKLIIVPSFLEAEKEQIRRAVSYCVDVIKQDSGNFDSLTEKKLRKMTGYLFNDFKIIKESHPDFSNKYKRILKKLSQKNLVIEEIDENKITGFGMLKCINGKPIILISVTLQRDLFLRGRNLSLVISTLIFFALILVAACFILWFLLSRSEEVKRREHIEALVEERTNALLKREKLIEELYQAAQMLLPMSDEVPFQGFVDSIGPFSNASRAYVFLNSHGADNSLLTSQVAEWCAEGIKPEIDNPELQNLSYDKFLPRWRDCFSRGENIGGRVADFPSEERKILEPQNIKALLAIPIIVDNECAGFIGFDNCLDDREWEGAEQLFLKSAANALAQAIKRKRLEKDVSQRLIALTRSDVDLKELKLTDIIELDVLQQLQDGFAAAFNISSAIYDVGGELITKPSCFTEFCSLIRGTEKGHGNCNAFENKLAREISENEPLYIRKGCVFKNIITATVPMIIQGNHIVNWSIGQLVDGELELDEIKDYAREIGLDENVLIEAAGKLKRVDDASLKKIVFFLKVLSEQISILAAQNLQQGRDIAERKRIEEEKDKIEEQLRHSQKMEAVGSLAGGIAHDFNNLLQVILTYTDFVLSKMPAESQQRSDLEQVFNAANRAAELTAQLLAFSRRQIIQPVDISITELIDDLLKMIRRLIGENIDLIFIPGKNQMDVHVDRGQIEQVLMNLCVNARDAMPNGGKLIIKTKSIIINEEKFDKYSLGKPGKYVLISVTDTGCGIDKHVQEHIFEPFFTTKEVGKGTGMGMATAYGIITQHGGQISVESELGKGTSLNIFLPAINRQQVISNNLESIQVVGGSETVLIAEDDANLLKLFARILTDAGYNVLQAKDGAEAVRIFSEHSDDIDIAVFDVVMPVLGGKEAMKIILGKRPDLPHFYVSGYTDDAVHTNFIQEHGLILLRKPYDKRTLLGKIRELLS